MPREKVLGFGCQWKGGTDSKIGVIQIATPCIVYIFHIGAYKERMENEESSSSDNDEDEDDDLLMMTPQNQIRKSRKKQQQNDRESIFDLQPNGNTADCCLMSHHLRYLLESSNYLKVGANISGDFMKLSEDFDLQCDPNSILDLGQFYNDKVCAGGTHWNLSTLCSQILDGEIDRNAEVAKSEWTQYPLNDEQIKYCSETAHFSLKLFFAIHQIKDTEQEYEYGDESESSFDDDDDGEYDFDFDTKISAGKLEKIQKNMLPNENITDLQINTNESSDDFFANIVCSDSPLFGVLTPLKCDVSMTQMDVDGDRNSQSLQPLNLMERMNELKRADERIDVLQNLLAKIRRHEILHYSSMDCILSRYWMWSWHDLIFPKRNCKVNATGNVNKRSLSLKKKEIYASFTHFGLDFDEIINFRGYPLDHHQIEMYLADIINLGYAYNWKQINDAILKKHSNEIDIEVNDDAFSVDFIFLQMKVIELIQAQMNQIFVKYPRAKQRLLFFYDDCGLNPYKLQRKAKNIKNDKKKNQNIAELIPKDYEEKLKKIKEIFDEIWLYVKLKPLRNEIIHFVLKQQDDENSSLKIDLSLIRYSLIRMIVFHIKRVVWSKHFILH